MPHGGELTVLCSDEDRGGARFVHVDLVDTGTGIPTTMQPRIFESFLSGRADGTGLGLAIAQRIVKDHHGELNLVTTSSRGTTMRISLPLAGG